MKKKIWRVLSKIVWWGMAAILLLTLAFNLSTVLAVSRIQQGSRVTFGYFSALIGSGSMEPAISVHDLLLVKGGTHYAVDDIITYVSPKGSLVTHRIKEVHADRFVTQGDANNIPDGAVARERVLGRVIRIVPGAGAVIYGLLSPVGILFLLCIVTFFWLIQSIRREYVREKRHAEKRSRKNQSQS